MKSYEMALARCLNDVIIDVSPFLPERAVAKMFAASRIDPLN